MVERLGFEPRTGFLRRIMSPVPATTRCPFFILSANDSSNTLSYLLLFCILLLLLICCQMLPAFAPPNPSILNGWVHVVTVLVPTFGLDI